MQELSKITMPVVFNEPLSFLQRVVEYMEYSDLIKKASDCNDPVERLEVNYFYVQTKSFFHNYNIYTAEVNNPTVVFCRVCST